MFKLIKKLLERLEIYNVILFLSFYVGIFLGSGLFVFLLSGNESAVADLLQNYFSSETNIDLFSLFTNKIFFTAIELVIIFVLGTSVLGKLAVFPVMLCKGAMIAFDFVLLFAYKGAEGIIPSIVCLLPQALAYLFIYYFLLLKTAATSDSIIKGDCKSKIFQYLRYVIKTAIILLVPSIYECFSISHILRMF